MTEPLTSSRRARALLFPRAGYENVDVGLPSAFITTAVGTFVQGLTRLGYSILIGRILGAEALGVVGQVIALTSFLVLLWPAAGANAASKYISSARGKDDPGLAAASAWTISLLALAVMVLLAGVGAAYAATVLDLAAGGALSTALLVVSLSAYNVVRGVRVGSNQFVTAALWDCLSTVLALSLLALVLVGRLDALLLIPLSCGYLAFAVSGWPRPAPLIRDRRLLRDIVHFTAFSATALLASGGLLQLTVVLARIWSTTEQVGYLSAAVQLATPASMLSGALLTALSPPIVRRWASGDLAGMRAQLDAIMRMMVAFFLPVFALGVLWAEPLITLVYGPGFAAGSAVLTVMFLAVSLTCFNASNVRLNGTDARGIREIAAANVAGLVIGLAVTAAVSPALGIIGTACGYLSGAAVVSAVPYLIVWRRDSMRWGGLTALILMGLAVIVAFAWWHNTLTASPWRGIAVSVAFVAIWMLLCRRQVAEAWRALPVGRRRRPLR